MLNFRIFLSVLFGVVLWGSASEARVCFLASGEDGDGCLTATYEVDSEKCSGLELCDYPRKGASVCIDVGKNYYRPEDCCSNPSLYERCSGHGMVCTGGTCISVGPDGEDITWCEIGHCQCDSSYSEVCDPAKGLEGVGEPCNGKYQSCRCGSSYYNCVAPSQGSGTTCTDDRGTFYSSCVCPTVGENGWVSDPDDCCGGYSQTCTTRPGGEVVYQCRTMSLPECVCGYSFSPSKQGCVDGCTDSNYSYYGEAPVNATCQDMVSGLVEGTICANGCKCNEGYWDFTLTCSDQNDNICEQLGYTDVGCRGDWVACIYDVTAKKCLN